ncbi:hypothetical protein KY319_02405 [Candidatus Woesearchaeota archaeon]|nr:hypothetical protein [Candidatus Woesearchaeota archaeon]
MSYVHLLVVKDDCVYFVYTHYRSTISLLNNVNRVLPLLQSCFLDSGYLVVDLNRKTVINGQSAFPVGKCIGKKDLFVIET